MIKEKRIAEIEDKIDNAIYQYSSNPYPSEKGLSNYVAGELVYASVGNLKEFAEQIVDVLDTEMANYKKFEENEKKEGNYNAAELMQVRYWNIHDLKRKIENKIKEYIE